jgi:hypothetical protein
LPACRQRRRRRPFQRALEADPDFSFRTWGSHRFRFLKADVPAAREAAAARPGACPVATPRERGHVNAIALAVEGKVPDSLAATKVHLAEHPRDAMVLAPATGVFGLIGFSGRRSARRSCTS